MTTSSQSQRRRVFQPALLLLLVLCCGLLAVAAAKAMPSSAQPAAAVGRAGGSVWRLLDAARGHGPEGNAAMGVSGRACERFVRGKAVDTDLAEVIRGFYNPDVNAAFA